MKRLFWIMGMILGAAGGTLAQTVSFNFSLGSRPVSGWINAAGDPAAGVITASDPTSGIALSSVATANWSPYTNCAYDGGGASGSGSFFPTAVLANHWFNYSAFYGAYNALMPQIVISGLNVDSVYTFKMTGSFVVGVPNQFNLDPIRYTVAGATLYGYVDIDGDSNYLNGATFHNVAPDTAGKVRIYVNTYGGSNVASICGLQIISGQTTAPTPSVTLTSPKNNAVIPEDGNITVTATASESGGSIARVEFYAGGTLIGSDSSAPYSITWFGNDPGNYTITARAIDGTGNTSTASVNLNVESLNYFWSTTGNIATGADTSFIGTVDTNRLAFRTNNVERMTILKDGSIGIGTKNTYGYLLAVNGTAIFTKAKVKTAGTWPDYVFGKNYSLPDLRQLQDYVRANH
ncbi:MAG TPA: Ig-like domain-containing protein, partial [Puia sp.]|nr:Ig-like domain-containing protein [Puia sp.]